MKAVLISAIGIFLLVLAFLVLRGFYHGVQYTVAAAAANAHTGSFSLGGTGPHQYGPYTIHGTVIMDSSHGIPAVPYIKYTDSKNVLRTKQLVYTGERPCAPEAGDFPCAPTYSTTQGYPELTDGEPITVTGYFYEDRLMITSLTPEAS